MDEATSPKARDSLPRPLQNRLPNAYYLTPNPLFIVMIKDLVCSLDYSICAEMALGLFVVAFIGILFGSLRLSKGAADRFASIPLNETVEDPRND